MDDVLFWLAFIRVPGLGPILRKRLLDRFGSPKAVFGASEAELWEVEGMTRRAVEALKATDPIKEGRELAERVESLGLWVLTLESPQYPRILREIPDPPAVLFVRGGMADSPAVAIVGSRRCSSYGRDFARRLARGLAQAGVTVVSGGARGIDTEAHLGALEGGGRTVAVLGSGHDRPYPAENRGLFERIAERGAVVSEFPPGTPPERWNFPQRNRIISGLALGVVVVEAPAKSGALITASLALEQGRSVFAVPGLPGSWTSQGTHRLLREGARLIEGPEDVLEEVLPQFEPPREEAPALGPEEERVLEVLRGGPRSLDQICRELGMPVAEVIGLLTRMELKGVVRQLPGRTYAAEARWPGP